jgi:hypothetical protein
MSFKILKFSNRPSVFIPSNLQEMSSNYVFAHDQSLLSLGDPRGGDDINSRSNRAKISPQQRLLKKFYTET